MMWYWGGGVHWWEWLVGAIGMIAFWGLLAAAVWYVVTTLGRREDRPERRGEDHPEHRDEARRILDERLARGDIDADEYQRLRDLLAGGPPSEREKTAAGSRGRA